LIVQKLKPKPKQKSRFVDPDVIARERGKVISEPKPEDLGHDPGTSHQPRGPPPDAQWLALANVARYLDVSTMSVSRYATDPAYAHLNFPRPSVVMDRSYWHREDIDAWMRSRVGAVSTRKNKSKGAA
jgi:predicted DNA-binding transcriptional regulator AlpA